MEPTASLSILALLMLGLTQAVPLMEPQHVDITTRILSTNNGSRELLLEGDIVLPRTRNALVCANNNCFWKKSSTGLVQVPFTVTLRNSQPQHTKQCMIPDLKEFLPLVPHIRQWTEPSFNPQTATPMLGRTGGKQVVSLSTRGCVYHGIVQHELNHALGFYHEHTRSDRDRYVTINWQNIDPTMQYNFNKENTNNLNTPYDYSSVMHYGKTAFTINGLNTITPIPDASVQIGQRVDLSVIDIQRINTLYNC
uniref:Metalloendopeptidase n=1 Tax=Astyanax mexicanus TaxID=7994 RepID=A0A8B9RKP1_ASTMX